MSDNRAVFITGGSGLLALNWALSIRDSSTVTLGMHQRNISLKGVDTCHCSLDSVDSIQSSFEKIKPELVIHTAGLTSVEKCESNPDLAHYANVEIAANMAKACSLLEIPLVHISTDHLFSGEDASVAEEQPVSPVNMYGKTKAEAESRVLDTYPEALVVRTNFYGWGPNYRRSFSDVILDSLRNNREIMLFEDVFYTPIVISKLVETVMKLASMDQKGIFHVVGNERLSKYEFGQKIANQFGLDNSLIQSGLLSNQLSLVRRPLDMSLLNKKVSNVLGENIGNVDDHLESLASQNIDNSYDRIISL